jgi:hypothetical protein
VIASRASFSAFESKAPRMFGRANDGGCHVLRSRRLQRRVMNMKSRLPLVFQPWSRTARAGPRSFWLQEALSEESDFEANLQQLRGSHRADVCIVGGGFTGLWTAIRLKEMEPSLG